MIPLSLDVIEPLGRVIARPWADVVTGMQVDSRRIDEGDLFVAVGGGEDFVEHAFARGASAALVPTDAFAALAAVAAAVRERSRARVVGITGSTGKTSTKDILFALCAPERRTIANEGNYNTEIGVPLTLCRIEEDTEICISELAMRGLGQIAWLASFVRPDVAVITNVGPVHLELVQTIENVARAKAEVLEALPAGGTAIVPEEPLLEPYLTRADISITRVDQTSPIPFRMNYSSAHQLANTRTAIATAEVLGVPLPENELTVEFSKLREEERDLPGGVPAAERLLQRQPRVDAGGVAPPRRARERQAARRGARRDGRARRGGTRVPPRDRSLAHRARDRRRDRGRTARPGLRRRLGRERR